MSDQIIWPWFKERGGSMTVQNKDADVAVAMAEAIFGAIMGAFLGFTAGVILAMTTFSFLKSVPAGVWVFFWLVVALSAVLGATIMVVLTKSRELRDLRSYVHTFFYTSNHQAGVDRVLKKLANQADAAFKLAIDLRINGVGSYGGADQVKEMGPDRALEACRLAQDSADSYFHSERAVFHETFNLVSKFKKVFSLNLKEGEFKAYTSADQNVDQTAEKAKSL